MNKKLLVSVLALGLLATTGLGLKGFAQADFTKALLPNNASTVNIEYQQQGQPATNSNQNSPYASSCHGAGDKMIGLMKENGFAEAAKYMENGDYVGMNNFMNNLSDADYQKMIELMKQNGYAGMAQHMESIGKEQMVKMHNSMMGPDGYNAMMDWDSHNAMMNWQN